MTVKAIKCNLIGQLQSYIVKQKLGEIEYGTCSSLHSRWLSVWNSDKMTATSGQSLDIGSYNKMNKLFFSEKCNFIEHKVYMNNHWMFPNIYVHVFPFFIRMKNRRWPSPHSMFLRNHSTDWPELCIIARLLFLYTLSYIMQSRNPVWDPRVFCYSPLYNSRL
jgi:hypothetical protein